MRALPLFRVQRRGTASWALQDRPAEDAGHNRAAWQLAIPESSARRMAKCFDGHRLVWSMQSSRGDRTMTETPSLLDRIKAAMKFCEQSKRHVYFSDFRKPEEFPTQEEA